MLQGRRASPALLNFIFVALIASAVIVGAFTDQMAAVNQAAIDSAKAAVDLAFGLVGQMALWLGLMKVLEEAGVLRAVARAASPLMRRVFPEVPADHPAMSAMILNLSANVMGLANAATPFGLKAMIELNKLNKQKGVATNSMALFLAINTSGVAVLPLGMIAVRASMNAADVTGIVAPSILANLCSTAVAILVAKSLERLGIFSVERYAADVNQVHVEPSEEMEAVKGLDVAEALAKKAVPFHRLYSVLAVLVFLVVAGGLVRQAAGAPDGQSVFETGKTLLSQWILPGILLLIVLTGFSKGVPVYEVVVKGAKEGFNIFVMIVPFLVAILVAIGMFRGSGAMDAIVEAVGPYTSLVGFPPEALPMALVRPLSGSGAMGVVMETMKAYGPDSFPGFLVSVMNGSTETTFYVVALYFGSVGVRVTRHTILACLAADFVGVCAATALARVFFSG